MVLYSVRQCPPTAQEEQAVPETVEGGRIRSKALSMCTSGLRGMMAGEGQIQMTLAEARKLDEVVA